MNATTDDQLVTRTNWDGSGAAQIDFIMASAETQATNVWVDKKQVWFNTDHFAVFCEWTPKPREKRPMNESRRRCVRGWAPGAEWGEAAEDLKKWGDWEKISEQPRETAHKFGLKKKKGEQDLVLAALVAQRSAETRSTLENRSSTEASGGDAAI
jgi:hypothetical protein